MSSVRGLGSSMRAVACRLTSQPMTFDDAHKIIGGGSIDLGYAAATLIRLHSRGIAAEVGATYTYVRGPNWMRAAEAYGWVP